MVLLPLKDPIESFVKGGEFVPESEFLSRRDMTYAVENGVTINSLPQ